MSNTLQDTEPRLAKISEVTKAVPQFPACTQTLRRMVQRGDLTDYRVGRLMLVDLNEIEQMLKPRLTS